MSSFELYSFFLSLIVYVLLVLVFTLVIGSIYVMNLKLIRHGIEDERIITEFDNYGKSKPVIQITSTVFSILLSLCFVAAFAFSISVKYTDSLAVDNVPVMMVVKSSSMATKEKGNKYLFENNLNNQFDTFDLVFTYKLPAEEDLKLYDIVVYEVDGELIIHRIVGIEEPNKDHPTCRYFLLQGDATKSPDYFPVTYSQMKSIYTGDRIPFVGSIVSFFQSPAGVLCIILVIFYSIITPLLNLKIEQEEAARYYLYGRNEIGHNNKTTKEVVAKERKKGLSTGKKLSIIFILFMFAILVYSISTVSASWNYSQGLATEYTVSNQVFTDWPIMSSKAELLSNNIVNDSTNGLNNSKSYLNEQIKKRKNNTLGGSRDTLGSMAVNQGDGLDEDFNLTANGVSFLLQFCEDSNGNEFYYLFITEVYLGSRGEINWIGNNKTPGNPTTPIGEYIYPIFRFKITKNASGQWVSGPEEVGSAKSAWYEESRINENATQIPSFDPDTWVAGRV